MESRGRSGSVWVTERLCVGDSRLQRACPRDTPAARVCRRLHGRRTGAACCRTASVSRSAPRPGSTRGRTGTLLVNAPGLLLAQTGGKQAGRSLKSVQRDDLQPRRFVRCGVLQILRNLLRTWEHPVKVLIQVSPSSRQVEAVHAIRPGLHRRDPEK